MSSRGLVRINLLPTRSNPTSLGLDGLQWSRSRLGTLVTKRNNRLVSRAAVEIGVQVLECSIGSLGVEEVDHSNECKIEAGKYWVEN